MKPCHLPRALLLLAALAGCEDQPLPPYETVPPALSKAQQKVKPQPTRVAVCYNSFTTSAPEVLAIAKESCDPGTVPKPVERDFSLNNCPLLEPARATFACTKP